MSNEKKRLESHLQRLKDKKDNIDKKKLVFAVQAKQYYYCRDTVCEFVFRQGGIPLNPYRIFGYNLNGKVDESLIRQSNSQLLNICDELWVFGNIANEMLKDIIESIEAGKRIRFFTVAVKPEEIREIEIEHLVFEPEVHAGKVKRQDILEFIENGMPEKMISQYSQMDLSDFL